ncbi:MAG: molybdopterin-dependent oxidoreductase [Candidatus Kapabacteria bacterium]|jgi:isoquinoline 1-oxidoreductase beta subunit|nr:molybdopterin-dependent oxidoreductase [Candidatus Kapabacteria bacterium]
MENNKTSNESDEHFRIHSRERPSRRTFLLSAGAGLLTIGIGGVLGVDYLRQNISSFVENGSPPVSTPDDPFVWFTIGADNRIMFFVPKIEIGQGIHTSLAQIAADELEADWDLFVVKQAATNHGFDSDTFNTAGSFSISSLFQPLREGAASVREMLRNEAAKRLNTEPRYVQMKQSFAVVIGDETKKMSFGEIVAGKHDQWEVVENPPLKNAKDFTLIGKPIHRVDFRDKVTGRAIYGLDARLPNMLYGAVVRPPRYGAVLKSAVAGEAATMKGVVKVVIEQGFAGVVAERRSVARAAASLIQCEWEGGMTWSQETIDKTITVSAENPDAVLIQERGKYKQERREKDLIEEYRIPVAAHAHLEPQAALADVRKDGITVIASTQTPNIVAMMIARALDVDKSTITVQPTYSGGGFGRRGAHDVGVEAALLSRAVGKPVHVGWTREEEMRYGYYRPPSHHILRGSVDGEGKIANFEHEFVSGDVLLAMVPLAAGKIGETLADAFGVDPGATTGALFEYDIPHHAVISQRAKLPFLTASWRGLGLLPNVFARESFIDELAFAAKKDPLQFRLEHLPDTELGMRYKAALKKAAEISSWGKPATEGRSKGLAMCVHAQTIAVQVAEVSISDGRLKVHHVWAVVDPGMVINPDGGKAQIQGGIMMGLSSLFHEKITFKDGIAQAKNFDEYPLLRLSEAPKISVEILQSSETPHGMGEVGVGPITAAVGNAVFRLIGKRYRELPFPVNAIV